ncbi:DUF2993 domain-containing protein [Nocardia asteroides]|uniref:LmeA family phospholipid-binding protein n=1 Tax=Nocardia asteroides TaxID=1824 RepID=UPI001E343F8A|nr:DUF2993 domain-containing protein [Nocardia asteroides]UGT62054.1 DUF2993 domain-containing protein [Nocardia asteroides]
MRALVILIVVAAIALIAGDRIAVLMAQNEIGRRIAAEYALDRDPAVDIGGFPFLTQAADGRYETIDIRAGEWSEQDVTVRDLRLTLTDVTAPLADLIGGDTSTLVAAGATAEAVVAYDTVRRFADDGVRELSDSPDGLQVTGTFRVEGLPFPVPATIVFAMAPTADGIELTPISVQAAVGGPALPLSVLSRSLAFTIPLQDLPLGAQITDIRAGPDGLHVSAAAADVRFADLP